MAKRVDLTITIKLPDDHGGVGLSIDNSGNIRIIDNDGNEITPESVKRAAHYDRPKGKKYQSNISAEGILATINGLEELADLDSFIVVDTNSIDIENTKVSVAFFVVCRLIKKHKGFTLESLDNCGHAYEFHDVSGNPELLSIYRIANDTLKGRGIPEGKYVGFVTEQRWINIKILPLVQFRSIWIRNFLQALKYSTRALIPDRRLLTN